MAINKNITDNEDEISKFVSAVIENEKQQKVNPFLAERIMERINRTRVPETISFTRRVLQVSAIAAGFTIAVLAGINLGKLYSDKLFYEQEVVSINDAQIERIELIINE